LENMLRWAIPHAQTQTELLAAIDDILNAGRATGRRPEHDARASRLLNIPVDRFRPAP
jgi:hypothetical protein